MRKIPARGRSPSIEPLGEALALEGEACRKAEEENDCLADERLALVMELGTMKDDFADFRKKAIADRETMEAEFDSSSDALFNYGYGCCVFTHNIYGRKPQIPDGMPDPLVPLTPEFFANPHCPPSVSSVAQALDPIAGSKVDHPETSQTVVGDEAIFPIGPSTSSDCGMGDAVVN